jgi:hypothetical protein
LFSPASAEIEIGVLGHMGWSDDFYLGDPDGWGMFFTKSLLPNLSFRFTHSRMDNKCRHIGIMQFGMPPPEPDTTREFIKSDVSVTINELSLHLRLFEGNKMRLETGVGLGSAGFDLDLSGESTGKTMSLDEGTASVFWSVDLIVKDFIDPPLALRLGFQQRRMTSGPQATCGFSPFGDVGMSSVYASLMVRW